MIVRVCTFNSHSSDRPTSKPSATKKFTPGFPVFGLVRMVNFRWHCKIPFPQCSYKFNGIVKHKKIASNNVKFGQELAQHLKRFTTNLPPKKRVKPTKSLRFIQKPRDAKRLRQKAHAVAWSTARVQDDSVGR